MLYFDNRPTAAQNGASLDLPVLVSPTGSQTAALAVSIREKLRNAEALRSSQSLNAGDAWLTTEENMRVLAIINESTAITSHAELFRWLQGAVQEFLPHEVLISAWGDFTAWKLRLDVTSRFPGARTEWIARCENFAGCKINAALRVLSLRWSSEGRRPFLTRSARELLSNAGCSCPLIKAVQPMRSMLVHGVHDERGGYDSLYVLLSTNSVANGRSEARVAKIAELLVPQIDIALRKVAVLPNAETTSLEKRNGESLGLTMREREIIDWISRGKINSEIAANLDISVFTVKNHLRRIFNKLGAANRADAAMKYQRIRQ